MKSPFVVNIDPLRKGKTEEFVGTYDATFLDLEEKEFFFQGTFSLKGEAYLAEEALIFHFEATAQAVMTCAICNEPTSLVIEVKNVYQAQELEEIRGHSFDCGPWIRESIVLEVPQFGECNEGQCPKRKDIGKYLQKKQGYHPFEELT